MKNTVLKAQVISNAQNRKIKNTQKRMEELNKLIIYDLKDVTVQQIKMVNCIQVCFWELIDYLINRDKGMLCGLANSLEEKWRLILITSNGILFFFFLVMAFLVIV